MNLALFIGKNKFMALFLLNQRNKSPFRSMGKRETISFRRDWGKEPKPP
jgi:hypothetical protein